MSFSAPCLSAVLLTILSLSASLRAQSAGPATKVTLGSISGQVTIKDKGVPGVAIGLRKGDLYTPSEGYQRTTTDPDGFYRISNVAAGSYTLIVAAPAFVPDAKDTSKQKTVLVGDGENVEGINFALMRGAVITGRVTDADGRPVIEQQVNVYMASMFEQKVQRTVYAVGSAQTDDRGIYRVFGLYPGRYKVAVGRSDNDMIVTYNQPRNVWYKQVFHPDVSDQAKATIIEVTESSEADNVDITVGRTLQTFSVSGQLVDESGQPVPNLRFGLQRQIDKRIEYTNNSTQANSRGEFMIEGLVPGRYTVFLYPNLTNELRVEPFTFDVVDQDLAGLTVKLARGASIAGIVVLENDDQAILAKLLQVQLRAYGTISMENGAKYAISGSSPIGPDGSFRVAGLPTGTINMSFGATGNPLPPMGFTITRIERQGVLLRGLEVKDGEQVTGLRVLVSYGSATLSGIVTFDNGPLPPRSRISPRLTKPDGRMSNLRPPVVDERGHFLIEGVPPGTYQLETNVNVPGQPARTVKREVILQDGLTTQVIINVNPTELKPR